MVKKITKCLPGFKWIEMESKEENGTPPSKMKMQRKVPSPSKRFLGECFAPILNFSSVLRVWPASLVKGQIASTLGFVGRINPATELCHCSVKAAIASIETNECG